MIKVLHVDDDPGYLELLSLRLKRHDADLEIAPVTSVTAALSALDMDSFDCIISDYQMPCRNGLELLREARLRDTHLPFIFLTGQGSESVAAEALRSGANSYFTKDMEFALIDRLAKGIHTLVRGYQELKERQRTTAELQKLHHAVMQSPNLIAITDAESRFEFCNTRFEEFTGYQRHEIMGHKPTILKSGLTPAGTYKEMWNALRAGETWRGVLINRKKNGDVYWESASISALRDEDGNIVRYVKIGEDITGALAREERLQILSEQYQELEKIINSGPSVVFLWRNEPGWPVEFVSTNVTQYGYTPEDFLCGKLLYQDIIHPDDLPRVIEQSRVKQSDQDENRFEQNYRIVTADGSFRWVKDITWIKQNEQGVITHFQGFILDYSSKKRLEEQLKRNAAELEDRVKEQSVSIAVSRLLAKNGDSTISIFQQIVNLIPSAFPTPEGANVRISYLQQEFTTSGFAADRASIRVPIREAELDCGHIEVCYSGISDNGSQTIVPDSKLELITSLAEMISLFLAKRHAVERITRARDFYLNLLDDLPAPMWRCDADGTIDYFNHAMVGFIGRTLEEELAEGWGASIHPDDRVISERIFATALQTRIPTSSRIRLRHQDGTYRLTENYVNPLIDDDGTFTGLIGSCHDITAIKESERRISESEEKYRSLVEMAQDGIIITQHGRFVYVNRACAWMVGYDVEEMIGSPFAEFVHPESLEQVSEFYHRRILGEDVPAMYETTLIDKQGNKRFVEINSRRIVHQGEPAVLTFIRDTTHRRQIQMELAHAQKLEAIGHLAAGIAHEINTPIQFVGDNTRFLKRAFDDMMPLIDAGQLLRNGNDADQARAIDEIRSTLARTDVDFLQAEIPGAIQQSLEGLDRVAKIVRAMKSFSHPGADEKTDTDINKIIEDTVTVSRNEWKYVADLSLSLSDELPLVPCLPNEMSQVFLNLIINAAHAIEQVVGLRGEAKGTITISSRRVNEHIEIRVSDTGIGIPRENHTKVFTPFFTTKPPGKGTGQGLAISLDVVANKHGGALFYESEPGSGTCFTVRLPLSGAIAAPILMGSGVAYETDVR